MSEPKPEYNNNPKVHVAQGFVPHFGTWSTRALQCGNTCTGTYYY